MDLTKIISISGKPGLYKLIKQSRTRFIVESIETRKKTAVNSSQNVSLLSNVTIYTLDEEEITLEEVFYKIAEKENKGAAISHKASSADLHQYFSEILPNYDKNRVYNSDLKKIFQWYNILQKVSLIDLNHSDKESDKEKIIEDHPQTKSEVEKE